MDHSSFSSKVKAIAFDLDGKWTTPLLAPNASYSLSFGGKMDHSSFSSKCKAIAFDLDGKWTTPLLVPNARL